MWQHHNGWGQQNEDDPHNLQRSIELDSQISNAFAQRSSTVRPEHRHLLIQPIEEQLKGSLLDKTNWLEFFSLAQRKARAHRSCHRESKCRFCSWARSSLNPAEQLPQPASKCHKSAHAGQSSPKRPRQKGVQSASSGNRKHARLASTSAGAPWSGSKRKQPPNEVPD
jgi:hypothetical protein